MSKAKTTFFCKSCGFESPKWIGKCPGCNEWNTFIEEIKPTKQTTLEAAGKSPRDQAAAVLNMYKWQAAQAWCGQNGLRFRVLTENDIFHQGRAR